MADIRGVVRLRNFCILEGKFHWWLETLLDLSIMVSSSVLSSPPRKSSFSAFSGNLNVSFSWLPSHFLPSPSPSMSPVFASGSCLLLATWVPKLGVFDYRRLCLVFLFLCFGAAWRNNSKGRCKFGGDLADLLYKNRRATSRLPVGIVCHHPRSGNKSSLL